MSVLKGNNPVHRGRTLRQTNHGRTGTKDKRDVNERSADPPPFHPPAYGRRPPELIDRAPRPIARSLASFAVRRSRCRRRVADLAGGGEIFGRRLVVGVDCFSFGCFARPRSSALGGYATRMSPPRALWRAAVRMRRRVPRAERA